MPSLLIVADDLTGACDTGVQFAATGVSTLVRITSGRVDTAASETSVLVVDTESRHAAPGEAAARVEKAARRGRDEGVEYFYKKTDSTLRGNVGAELEAFMRGLGAGRLAFIPAFPAAGRTTRGGRQFVRGMPLDESPFADDPREPALESHVPAILARQTDLPVEVISTREGGAREAFAAMDNGIAVFDCENDADLRTIAGILSAENALAVTAGPGGFASVLAELIDLPRSAVKVPAFHGPLLAVSGSAHPVSVAQADFALRHGFREIIVPADASRAGALVREAGACATAGAHVVVRAPRADAGGSEERRVRAPADRRVSADLARFAADCLESAPFGACVVFGGDTAAELMLAIGAAALRPRLEIVPGVVLSECDAPARPLGFVTKAGGFGDEGVLVRIADFFDRS